jgi:hypothetical protein
MAARGKMFRGPSTALALACGAEAALKAIYPCAK